MEAKYSAKIPGPYIVVITTIYIIRRSTRLPSLSILTGGSLLPDMLLSVEDKCLYVIELTVGFETNRERNAERKEIKYRPLLKQFENKYRKTKFINLSTKFSWNVWSSF